MRSWRTVSPCSSTHPFGIFVATPNWIGYRAIGSPGFVLTENEMQVRAEGSADLVMPWSGSGQTRLTFLVPGDGYVELSAWSKRGRSDSRGIGAVDRAVHPEKYGAQCFG
jgi:hypothetical protein